jgi:AcrR family transcriptional regulator
LYSAVKIVSAEFNGSDMAKLSYKERARLRREQEILKTAARMIRDQGYANLNMDELAEQVGISKPTLYQHFKGKDDMVVRAMLSSIEAMEAYMDELSPAPAIDHLEAIMRYMLNSHADPDGFSVAIMRDTSLAMRHLTDAPEGMVETQLRVNEKVMQLVERAKAEGDIAEGMPNVVVIGMMFSSVAILQGPRIMRDHSASLHELIDSTVAFFRHGVSVGVREHQLH